MEILLWLVPPVLVTVVAMAWVGWLGREGRGEVDRDEAARRIGAALERESRPGRERRARREPDGARTDAQTDARQGSSGVVVRRPRPAAAPVPLARVEPLRTPPPSPPLSEAPSEVPSAPARQSPADPPARRAS